MSWHLCREGIKKKRKKEKKNFDILNILYVYRGKLPLWPIIWRSDQLMDLVFK